MLARPAPQGHVITVRKATAGAFLGSLGQGLLASALLNLDRFRQFGAQNLIPSDHRLSVLADDLLHALVEVGLQILIRLHAMRAHEIFDFRIRVPLSSVYLVASDMNKLIGETLGHFADKLIEKMVSMLFCWIH